ncbi:hypothetical protein, partial [Legionella santicrucis]
MLSLCKTTTMVKNDKALTLRFVIT